MVSELGMSQRLGPLSVKPFGSDPFGASASDRLMSDIDAEVRSVLEGCNRQAIVAVEQNRHVLDPLVAKLVEVESLEGDVLASFLAGAVTVRSPAPA
jgi:cell division protease FtsH